MEEWKQIPGYENYEVSNLGNVRGKQHVLIQRPSATSMYKYVNMKVNNKNVMRSVHRLVGYAFIPNPDNKPTIDHINRDKYDNRVENLRWATLSEQAINKHYSNISGHRNICKSPSCDRYIVSIWRDSNRIYYKYFKTLPEAIAARDLFLGHIGRN